MNSESKNISGLLDAIGNDELTQATNDRIRERKIISNLIVLRTSQGSSQSDIAQEMGCTQSRVSKLEQGADRDLRISDIEAYMRCCGHTLSANFLPSNWTIMDKVKHHAFEIVRQLQAMCELSNGDETMEAGAVRSHVETLSNMVRLILESAVAIPCVRSKISNLTDGTLGSGGDMSSSSLVVSEIEGQIPETV